MDILEILKTAREQLYPEDLAFFKTELETGDYTEAYIAECKQQLELVKKWLCGEEERIPQAEKSNEMPGREMTAPVMDIYSIAPRAANLVASAMSPEEMLLSDLKAMREGDGYKSKFKEYVRARDEIDAAFVDRHHSFFLPWELNAIVSVKQLDEAFLEKYFCALDKDKIARYQCFSEGFFIKHYAQLDAAVVLTKGKNEWRKKGNRSKQLDVFLRLKGVRL